MSLRPEIRGFHLEKLRRHFGSGNRALIAELEAALEDAAGEEPEEYGAEYMSTFRTALYRAIMEGVPFADLQVEGDPHVQLAVMLAEHGQQFLETDSSYWRLFGFEDFLMVVGEALPEDARQIFRVFLEGRPLFGRAIQTTWSYYGYLERKEVELLSSALGKLREMPELAEDELVADLVSDMTGWCDQISSAGMDLWYWTA